MHLDSKIKTTQHEQYSVWHCPYCHGVNKTEFNHICNHCNSNCNAKCYIAGKIGDLPEEVYKANFERAKKEVIALGYEPVSPVDLPHNHGKTWREYMSEDLHALLDCDAVYAQHNVRFSPGGMIEINLANAIGINVIHQKP